MLPNADVDAIPAPDERIAQASVSSRRALLAGAAGGTAALVAMLTRPARLQAAAGDPIRMGQSQVAGGTNTTVTTNSTGVALKVVQNGTGTALRGEAATGTGVTAWTGAKGKFALTAANGAASSGSGAAINADGGFNTGLRALTLSSNRYGVHASNDIGSAGTGAAIRGDGAAVDGVYGFSIDALGVHGDSTYNAGVGGGSFNGVGVYGESTNGTGVQGKSPGYGIYADGSAFVKKSLDIQEQGAPSNPPANIARLYVRDVAGQDHAQRAILRRNGGEPRRPALEGPLPHEDCRIRSTYALG